MTTKKVLYHQTQEGGITFTSERKAWDVEIPAYVYDLWMPLLGAEAIGVYGLYCRLEMGGTVKKMTMRDIARACRVGDKKLAEMNTLLEQCGFISLRKPTGAKRLMHWTTEVVVKDPPRTIRKDHITMLQHPQGYTPVTHWLCSDQVATPETPDSVSEITSERLEETPDSDPKIEPLGIEPLGLTTTMGGATAPGGGGSPGDCSWKTETYRYLMQIHHQYPTVFKQPNGKNAKKYAELPLALVQKITEECVAHGLGTGLLMNKLQGALDFPPPPPVEAAPADDTPEPEVIPPPFMPMDEWAQIVSPFEREVWALTVYRDGVLTTDSTLDRHINYDYAARRDRILARIGGGA